MHDDIFLQGPDKVAQSAASGTLPEYEAERRRGRRGRRLPSRRISPENECHMEFQYQIHVTWQFGYWREWVSWIGLSFWCVLCDAS